MKPYLLMLLLAIPPLISSIVATERAESGDVPAVKVVTCPKEVTVAPPVTPPPATKPKPAHGSPAGVKAWFIM